MTDALTTLNDLNKKVEDSLTAMREAAQDVVKQGTAGIFAEYGDILHSFGWAQYTPYFCDGDPCTFGMNDPFLIAKADVEAVDEWEREEAVGVWQRDYVGSPSFGYEGKSRETLGYGGGERTNPNFEQRYADAEKAVAALYKALSTQDIAKEVFGDHVIVTFTPEGVDVEEYDHE